MPVFSSGSRSVALQTRLRRLHRPPVHRRGGGERPELSFCLSPAGGAGAPWRSGAASAPGGSGLKADWDPERPRSAGSETPIASRFLRYSERETRKEEGRYSDLNPSPKSHRTIPSPGLVRRWGREEVSRKQLRSTVLLLGYSDLAPRENGLRNLLIPSETFISFWEVWEPWGEVWRAKLGDLAPLEDAQCERGTEECVSSSVK